MMSCIKISNLRYRTKVIYAVLLCASGLFMIIASLSSLSYKGLIATNIRYDSPTFFTAFLRTDNASHGVFRRLGGGGFPGVGRDRVRRVDAGMTTRKTGEGFRIIPNCTRRNTGVEDILCMQKPDFLPQFRNPCWYEQGKLRCLPYFHIIGVCKSGTTDLFRRLVNHPHLLKNKGMLNKEVWYWTWLRYGESNFHQKVVPKTLLNQFIDSFDSAGIERIRVNNRTYVGEHFYPAVTGHGDPMDFWDQLSWKMIPQNDPDLLIPEVTTPSLIKHVNPDVKLILVLRDPIQRLFSHYLHGKFGTSAAQFHHDVITTVKSIQSCNRTLALKACLYSKDLLKQLRVPISASFYSVHLTEWLRVFPRKQILIIRTEDLSNDMASNLIDIFRFLKLDPLPTSQLYIIARMPHFYKTAGRERAGSILPETIQVLQDVFQPYNRQLAYMLNDTRFLWDS